MQNNPVAFMVLFLCVGPMLLMGIGFWLGRGGPLPGGRRLHVGLKQRDYDDELLSR
jgi:hypothetical protein